MTSGSCNSRIDLSESWSVIYICCITAGWILKFTNLNFKKKQYKLPIKKRRLLFVVGMFSHLSASSRAHFAKLQQGSHATSWPVEQAGQTLHRLELQKLVPESNESNAPFWWHKKPLVLGHEVQKMIPKCPVFFWGGAQCPMKYDWGLLILSRTSGISACQHITKGRGCYFENFTPKKGGIQITAVSRKAIKNSHLYLSSGTIFSIHRLMIFRNSSTFFCSNHQWRVQLRSDSTLETCSKCERKVSLMSLANFQFMARC